MLTLNVVPLLQSRGVDNPVRWLQVKGMPYHQVNRILNGKNKSPNLSFEMLEKLCVICSATPNELIVWKPAEDQVVPDDHPLIPLREKPRPDNPVDRLKQLPRKKLEKLKAFMDELDKEE